ncbi:peptidoglycan recognition protein family protein [Streptomyces sp.]|uniref:peptidoglycan recognition protein family protein n=1 Tax=Streptomyces sp. TaxID=1931 RepID=UPI002D284B75|nr:N-acetylmuramoyl-L-alanine amidase [Streptomyces sp.]HZF91110.1 N-acetylmuramoyl-L-alanine amidase [Streptomyces sp.]
MRFTHGRTALFRADTSPFSMLGVTWDDPTAPLPGAVEVRTHPIGGGAWTDWTRLDSGDSHGDDTARRGGTDPLWAGPADRVEVRIVAAGEALTELPDGLRVDLIDPGPDTSTRPLPAPPAMTDAPTPPAALSAPRPVIVSRAGWGADESISTEPPVYVPDGKIKAVVVHHTADSNNYTCAQAPSVIRAVYAYHVKQLGWRDIGYNFLADKCGTLYEGRKGGVDRAVMGAHTYGFNSQTTGIAVLGTHTSTTPTESVLNSVAALAAWKLGQYGADPAGTTTLTAGADGNNYFHKSWKLGDKLTFPTIHGHRDGHNTQCPGDELYAQLPAIRTRAATVTATGRQ